MGKLVPVPQVTEEVAIAVVDLYPTLVSLANAYSLLVSALFYSLTLVHYLWYGKEGDVCAQEEMLRKQSNNKVSSVAISINPEMIEPKLIASVWVLGWGFVPRVTRKCHSFYVSGMVFGTRSD
ncbi:crossover junction endonuclease MUS81 isoform X2 [Gossypium australe]|uniref:Crossover junction endonuclease MUS81 n=1 Tax=Gossypium australe TaxID=47621 RepID=A0A5B6U7N1_9ROSI|nr:crossover junction endonuclease MUS81 isoform X2 [Gossypium australe]